MYPFKLLLSLKQMSENLIFKSVKVEKKLQKLIHDEQVNIKLRVCEAVDEILILNFNKAMPSQVE